MIRKPGTNKRLKFSGRRLTRVSTVGFSKRVQRVVSYGGRCRRQCRGGVPIVITNKVFSRGSVSRTLSLNTSNIRVTDHFITARRYSTSRTCGRTCVRTDRRGVRVVRDPINVPKHTLHGGFVSHMGHTGLPIDGYCGYLRGYDPRGIPCYVAGTLVSTIHKSIRGNLMFYKTGAKQVRRVAAMRRLVRRLTKSLRWG